MRGRLAAGSVLIAFVVGALLGALWCASRAPSPATQLGNRPGRGDGAAATKPRRQRPDRDAVVLKVKQMYEDKIDALVVSPRAPEPASDTQ